MRSATPAPPTPADGPLDAAASVHWRSSMLAGGSGPEPPVCVIRFDADRFDPAWFAACAVACPPSIARSVHRRQAEFFYGRLAARRCLERLGVAPVDIGIGEFRQPLWPDGVVGSITHSGPVAAALVASRSRYRGLGLDIEQVVSGSRHAALLSMVVDSTELAGLEALVTADRSLSRLLTIVFSAKESLFKGVFARIGRYFDFSAVRVVLLDVEAGRIVLEPTGSMFDEAGIPGPFRVAFGNAGDDMILTCFSC